MRGISHVFASSLEFSPRIQTPATRALAQAGRATVVPNARSWRSVYLKRRDDFLRWRHAGPTPQTNVERNRDDRRNDADSFRRNGAFRDDGGDDRPQRDGGLPLRALDR